MLKYEQTQSLNELELNVYNYILQHKNDIANMSIRELAKASHVSTSTVYNFLKKSGSDGFIEFKLKLKMSLETQQEHMAAIGFNAILDALIKIETEKQKEKQIEKAVNMLKDADSIIFTGTGQSAILSKYASIYFANLDIHTQYMGDAYYRIPTNNKMLKIVIVVISQSGENQEIIYRMEKYKDRGIEVIAITNTEDNTVAKLSNVVITYNVPEQIYYEHKPLGDTPIRTTTQVPVMYILEKLANKLNETKNISTK